MADAFVRVAAVWGSSIFDVQAWWRYPSWTRGRHAVLIDDGRSPSPEKLAAEMDRHIQAMADLLGQPVPNKEFPWVRGSLFGFNGRALFLWAICAQVDAGELTDNRGTGDAGETTISWQGRPMSEVESAGAEAAR